MRVLAKCLLVKSPINSATVWRVTVEGGEVHNYLCVKNSLTVEKQLWREPGALCIWSRISAMLDSLRSFYWKFEQLYLYIIEPSWLVDNLDSKVINGLSAALVGVMGSRFKKSGKLFPAGVVSLVSLVMTGGYLHGILRSLH
ncbi:Protein fatty acid export 2, chloroplastic [Vitis vinifera]|uniref:Protein fatty acid export 2, chloroplastic n=1 Tax=Vitis vinifera TaxID=29760 RepID=A0A438F5R6_VITVI|nr:Protein fatty acid export 2, chloroplastic [Vitis vinifera]